MTFSIPISITAAQIGLNDLWSRIMLDSTGAVRGVISGNDGHDPRHLEYEAHQPVAEITMKQMTDAIRAS